MYFLFCDTILSSVSIISCSRYKFFNFCTFEAYFRFLDTKLYLHLKKVLSEDNKITEKFHVEIPCKNSMQKFHAENQRMLIIYAYIKNLSGTRQARRMDTYAYHPCIYKKCQPPSSATSGMIMMTDTNWDNTLPIKLLN